MSDKHYFPDTLANQLVPRALRALVRVNPFQSLIESERVVYNNQHDSGRVSVISGGGSGHEPGWAGYVGQGLLSAAACGDIFASPSTKQVAAAMAACPSDKGTILMITNYTGDRLHFGLASERARAAGQKIVVLPATDDVSIPRSRIRVGRRGMPGHVLTLKAVGAASEARYTFESCVEIGKAVNDSLVTIGSALDHCHVPGRTPNEPLGKDVAVVGAGIHNEPGAEHITPFPSVESLIDTLLKRLCDPSDKERYFVTFNPDDQVILLVNNYGGMSNLELGALTDEVLSQLESTWKIKPIKSYCGTFETSLNGPGFSVSLCNVTQAARDAKIGIKELLGLLEAPTAAPAWPNAPSAPLAAPNPAPNLDNIDPRPTISAEADIKIDSPLLASILKSGCEAAMAAEPKLTEWDMVMGDGDCGEAVYGVSKATIALIDGSAAIASSGSVFKALFAIIQAVDDMGGTLGAILGILLSAFASELQAAEGDRNGLSPALYSAALAKATESLKTYTAAREGDRTVMDVLIPFADEFARGNDFAKAVRVAQEKAEGTRNLRPRFGRATYVGEDKEQALPDPGAWAMFEFLAGMEKGMKQ